jgi:hypothetical protein
LTSKRVPPLGIGTLAFISCVQTTVTEPIVSEVSKTFPIVVAPPIDPMNAFNRIADSTSDVTAATGMFVYFIQGCIMGGAEAI